MKVGEPLNLPVSPNQPAFALVLELLGIEAILAQFGAIPIPRTISKATEARYQHAKKVANIVLRSNLP